MSNSASQNIPSASRANNSPAASASNTASDANTRNSNTASDSASASASRGSASGSGSASGGGSATNTGLPNIGSASQSVSVITGAPSLSSATQNGPLLSLTGLPTLSGAFSYPPASVPPTYNAPYMKTSQLPQNFVFIVVGGVLAFILLIVVLWRSLTAWSINRSFKKDSAAMYTPLPDIKKKPVKSDSGMDMADLSGAKLPKSFNSVPSLFFSPTAEVARQSMIRPQSQHMPGGHYRDASKGSGM